MATQDDYIRTALRVPPELHARIHEAAKTNTRTFNAEIVARLQASFEAPAVATSHSRTLAASAQEQVQAARTDWAERFNLYRIEAQLDAVRTQHALAEMKVRMLDDKLDKLAYGGGSKVQMRGLEVELEEARTFHKILKAREQEIFELLKAQQARADEASRAELMKMHEAIDLEIQDDLKAVHSLEQQLGVPPDKRTVFSTEPAPAKKAPKKH